MKKMYQYIYGGLVVLISLILICFRSLPDGKLHIFVLDVGQGDSILVVTPAQEYILIDGGPDDKVVERLSQILPFYERTIDVIILTHPHSDHVNGLIDVLKRYRVRQVFLTGVSVHHAGYDAFLQLIANKKIPVVFAGNNFDYRIGNIMVDILYPFNSLQNQVFDNLNNTSIVFRLLYGNKIFYFGGDLEMEKEKALVESNLDLQADFLKVGHHGSKSSSTEVFLDRIRPREAVISCSADNNFGHPHFLTLRRLQKRTIPIYRTDIDGTVEAVSDGLSLKVWTWGKSR